MYGLKGFIGQMLLSLGYAFLRRMLKLGKTADGRAGLVYEVPYQQTHTFSPLMHQQSQELIEEVAAAIGGTFNESISIPQSRNIRGVYSDLGGGIQRGSYTIKFDN